MEWTWQQQLHFFLQSGGVGFFLGMLYDVCFTASSACRSRVTAFVLDALFGVLAALVTFFAALAMMDGRLHPLLFVGCGIGFLVQHSSIGRPCTRLLRRGGAWLRRRRLAIGQAVHRLGGAVSRRFSKPAKAEKPAAAAKNGENEKKVHFFSKNS